MEDNYNIDGYMNLAAAIVIQAARDYARALRRLKKRPDDEDAKRTIRECELFFRQDAEFWTNIDGELIIKEIRLAVEQNRRIMRCGNV